MMRLLCTVSAAALLPMSAAYAQTTSPTAPAKTVESPLPSAAPADPTPPAEAVQTDEPGADIVVTASKREETLREVPMSITAITGDALTEKGINNVQDLVKVTPGLSYAESGLGTPVYSLRGVGFFETSIAARPTVSVYTDEAPLPFSIMTQGAAFDLERVEILKGPQGTLFGTNSTGGAINYIAAKPKSTFGAGGTISFARFNTLDAQAYVTGPLAEGLNARLAVRSVHGDGWQRSYTRDDTLGRQRFTQARLLLDWDVTDRLRLSANVNGFIDRGDTQAPQLIGILYVTPRLAGNVPLLGSYPLSPEKNRAADWDPDTDFRRNTRFYQGVIRGDYDLSEALTVSSLTSWSRILINQNSEADGTALPSSNLAIVGKISSFSQELRLTGQAGPARFIVGGNYAKDHSVENDYLSFPYASAVFSFTPLYRYDQTNPFTTQDFTTKALFGNVDVELGKFVLHGGVRYTDSDLDYSGCTKVNSDSSGAAITTLFNTLRGARGLAPIPFLRAGQCQSLDATLTPNLRVGEFDQDNVSWRAGVDFKPVKDILLYANVSRGYKAGSVPAPGAINLEEFDPVNQESVLAYEAGFKALVLNRKVDLSAAAFYYDYTDKQLLARRITEPNLLGALPALINVPKSRIAGAEAQISVFPVRGLTLTGAATYLDTKVTSDFENFTILATRENFRGNPFPYTPKWQLVFDGEYKFPLSDRLNGLAGANLNYRSKTTAGFGTNDFLKIDDYAILDLRAGIEAPDGRWSAQIFGRNVTDSYYWTNVAKFNDTVRRYAGTPATYGVQFSVKY